MRLVVNRLKPIRGDVSVDLGCREVDMPQELLDAPQVRPPVQQVSGEGVSQRMGRDLLVYTALLDIFVQDAPYASVGEPRAEPVQKDRVPGILLSGSKVLPYGRDSGVAYRHHPLL